MLDAMLKIPIPSGRMITITTPAVLLSIRNEAEKNAEHWNHYRDVVLSTMWRRLADIASEALETRGVLEVSADTQDEPHTQQSVTTIRSHREVESLLRCAIRQAYHYAGRQDQLSLTWREIAGVCMSQNKTGCLMTFVHRLVINLDSKGVQTSTKTPLLRVLNNTNNVSTSTRTSTYGKTTC